MSFFLKVFIFYLCLSLIAYFYKDLPFSKIKLRKVFPYFGLFIFLFSLVPFYIYFLTQFNCEMRCGIFSGVNFTSSFSFYFYLFPFISFILFLLILWYYILKDKKFKVSKKIVFGFNKNGIQVKGILNPFIHIDRNIWSLIDKEEKRAILKHEIWHIKNHDTLIKFLLRTASITFFYILPLWFLYLSFNELSELSADEFSLIETKKKTPLLKAIARLTLFLLPSTDAVSFFSSSIIKRITFIEKGNTSKKSIVIVFLAMLTLVFTIGNFIPADNVCQNKCCMEVLCSL